MSGAGGTEILTISVRVPCSTYEKARDTLELVDVAALPAIFHSSDIRPKFSDLERQDVLRAFREVRPNREDREIQLEALKRWEEHEELAAKAGQG